MASAGHPLLDRNRRGNSGEGVDFRLAELIDELTGVGGHGLHEASLPFGKDDAEGKGSFPDPEGPVTTTNLLAGIVTVRFFRLFSRAPIIFKSSFFKALRFLFPFL